MAIIELFNRKTKKQQEVFASQLEVITTDEQREMADAKQEVLSYVDITARETASPSQPILLVEKDVVRELLLKAGYTSIALGKWKGMDTNIRTRGKETEHYLKFYHQMWHRVDTLDYFFGQTVPELDEEAMHLRRCSLSELERLREIKKLLTEQGKLAYVGNWEYDRKSKHLVFRVLPYNEQELRKGHFTLEDIQHWLENEGRLMRRFDRQ